MNYKSCGSTLKSNLTGICSHNKFNRFFDTISLRYLYNEFEHHEFTPGPDGYATFNAQDETKKTQEATAGISGSANGVTPSLELHVTSERTLTVARDYKSWRRGVSMEKCESHDLSLILH